MLNKNDILKKLVELKPILKRDYAVKEIGLFGSFALDEATKDSDIDLIIEFDKPIGWRFFSLEIYLEKIFNRKIDLVTKNALKEKVKEGILSKVNYV